MSILWQPETQTTEVLIDWQSIGSREIKAGTPMSLAGVIANNSDAVGLVLETVNRPWSSRARLIVAGFVDLDAAKSSSSYTLTAEAIAAMPGITFVDDGTVVVPSGGGLPDPTPYSDGTVLVKAGNEWKAQSGYGYEEEAGTVHTIDPKFIPKSGMPDPAELADGTALVAVNGEWKKQSGYGYFESASSVSITINASSPLVDGKYTSTVELEDFVVTSESQIEITFNGTTESVSLTAVDSFTKVVDIGDNQVILSSYYGKGSITAKSAIAMGFVTVSGFNGNSVRASIPQTFSTSLIAKELPSFTAADNGKVLGVVGGQLAWVTP